MHEFIRYGKEALAIELQEAEKLPQRLDANFVRACELILSTTGKVVVSGIGKSGHISKKIAASLASTGTPAFFVHPAEALHGDLGMIDHNDLVIFISYSGRAKEIDLILPLLQEHKIPIIAFTGNPLSVLAKNADCVLNIHVDKEACPMGLAPTSSSVNTLMLGDALVIALMRHRNFGVEDFARSHPGGSLGAKLLNRVHHIMRRSTELPVVTMEATVMDALWELSRTGLGLVVVCSEKDKVKGVFTDGDLRRWLIKEGSLKEQVINAMTIPGFRLLEHWKAKEALEALHAYQISAAPVVNEEGKLVGAINIHDLHQSGIELSE